MRASTPTFPGRRDEAVALDELLERVEQLGDAYGPEFLYAVEPWVERARDLTLSNGSAHELRRVRDAIEETLFAAACERADDLMLEYGPRIDALLTRAGLFGIMAQDLAAVVIDEDSPDVPDEFYSRPSVSVAKRETLAAELFDTAPNTAGALRAPPSETEHDVVVVTLGRVLRTARRVRGAGTA